MCGLFVVVSLVPDRRLSSSEVQGAHRGLLALHHRGPDGQGVYLSPGGRAFLGHRRLSIIGMDPVRDAQPIVKEDQSLALCVNGELYDHEEERRALVARGHRFCTATDSEVALHLYEERRGQDASGLFARLDGEFALALWDEPAQTLLCGRDPFGVKPLLYAQSAGLLVIASEAKALFASGLVKPAWDEAACFQSLSLQYLLPEQTLFAGVRRIPPGHFLRVTRDGSLQIRRYADLDLDLAEKGPGDLRAEVPNDLAGSLVTEVAESLHRAVRRRLRADVPVSCQLSGGLDSSSVLGAMTKEGGAPVPCFSVRFCSPSATGNGKDSLDDPWDEGAIAQETAALHGAPLHLLELSQSTLLTTFPDAVAHGEGLAINLHIAAKYLLSKAVRDAGFKVILTGEGADEVLLGYAHLRQDYAAFLNRGLGHTGLDSTRADPVTAGIHLPLGTGLDLAPVQRALGFVPSFLAAKATLGFRMRRILCPDFVQRGGDPAESLCSALGLSAPRWNPVRTAASLWTRLALFSYILHPLGDTMEMAHGIEGRLPFLDRQFVEVARKIPLSALFVPVQGGLQEKTVLRNAMRPLLSETVFTRPKHPFMGPPLLLTDELQDLLRSGLRSGALPFFSRPALLALLQSLPSLPIEERRAHDPVLLMALSASVLARSYNL